MIFHKQASNSCLKHVNFFILWINFLYLYIYTCFICSHQSKAHISYGSYYIRRLGYKMYVLKSLSLFYSIIASLGCMQTANFRLNIPVFGFKSSTNHTCLHYAITINVLYINIATELFIQVIGVMYNQSHFT